VAREEIRIDLTTNDDASQDIDDVADAADDLERMSPEVTVTAETGPAVADMDKLEDAAQRAARAAEDVGDGAQRGSVNAVNATRDMTGPLGEVSSQIGDMGESFAAMAEVGVAKLGLVGTKAGDLAMTALPAVGIAIGAAMAIWGQWRASQDKTNEKIKETTELLREAADDGIDPYAESATKMIRENAGLARSMDALGVSGGDLASALDGDLNPSVLDAIDLQQQYRRILETTASGSWTQIQAIEALGAAHGWSQQQTREHADAADTFVDALEGETGALDRSAAQLAVEQGLLEDVDSAAGGAAARARDLEAAYEDLHDELGDSRSYLDAQDGFDQVAAAAAAAYTAAVTGSADAEQAARDQQRAVLDLKGDVVDYAEAVGGIPPEQVTRILAMIDRGELAQAEAELAALERARTVSVGISKGAGWGTFPDWLARGAPSTTTNVTINAPRGTRPADLIAAGEAYARRNGVR
jgi:hypothetical protein